MRQNQLRVDEEYKVKYHNQPLVLQSTEHHRRISRNLRGPAEYAPCRGTAYGAGFLFTCYQHNRTELHAARDIEKTWAAHEALVAERAEAQARAMREAEDRARELQRRTRGLQAVFEALGTPAYRIERSYNLPDALAVILRPESVDTLIERYSPPQEETA